MKKFLIISFLPFMMLLGCKPDTTLEKTEDIVPEFYLVDLTGYSDDFDTMIKDDAHILFISHYDNDMVKEYYVVSESDTLAISFSKTGLPEYLKYGDIHFVFGNYSEHSVHMAVIDGDNKVDVVDLETETNWLDYVETLRRSPTKSRVGKTFKKEVENIVVSSFYDVCSKAIERLTSVSGTPRPVTIGTFLFSAIGYAVSDNPTWWDVVDFISEGTNRSYLIAQAGKVASQVGGIGPVAILVAANAFVWYKVYTQVRDGIHNGQFGSPFVENYDILRKEIDGGVWFASPSPLVLDWQTQQGNIPLKMGIPNFDINEPGAIDIGVKKGSAIPSGWNVKVVGSGRNRSLQYFITPNMTKTTKNCKIILYVAGVSNIDYDLYFTIQQLPQIQFDPEEVYFEEMTPVTVTVTSLLKERWEIEAWPAWLDYDINRIATQAINSIKLTPKYLEGASESSIVFSVTTNDGWSHYTKYLPVHPKKKKIYDWEGTGWYCTFNATEELTGSLFETHSGSDDFSFLVKNNVVFVDGVPLPFYYYSFEDGCNFEANFEILTGGKLKIYEKDITSNSTTESMYYVEFIITRSGEITVKGEITGFGYNYRPDDNYYVSYTCNGVLNGSLVTN